MTDDFDFSMDASKDPVLNPQGLATLGSPAIEVSEEVEDEAPKKKASGTRGSKAKSKKDSSGDQKKEEASAETEETEEDTGLPKYDKDELLAIFDAILFQGEYRETVSLGRKASVVFRSRTGQEAALISRTIDGMNFKMVQTVEDHRMMLNLAYSMVEFNGRDLSNKNPTPDRYKFVGSLPVPVLGRLVEELSKFDHKVFMAMEEARENF